jgi:transcriptional regulator with XRE-family HTH domain
MDPTRAIWHNDAVRTALQAGDLGAIVRAVRVANNLTLADLSERCGYSTSTLSRLERGKQRFGDVDTLRIIGRALRIPPNLLGLADTTPGSVQTTRPIARVGDILAPAEEIDPMRRRTLLAGFTGLAGTTMLGSSTALAANDPVQHLENTLLNPSAAAGPPAALAHLKHDVATTRLVFQHGRYADVAARLPGLLSATMATRADSTDGELAVVNGLLAELYTVASGLMVKFGNDQLAWTTADRALQAAMSTDDVLTQATARRAWAIVLRRAGRAETAERMVIETAAALQPVLHRGPDAVSVYGSLLSTAAYTAAVDGDRGTARTLIDEAAEAATLFGSDDNHRFTGFGPTSVGMYQVSIARVLGDPGTAIETARTINPASTPLVERRARFWADVARSFHQWGKPAQCYRALLAAEKASPDEVRYRKPIQRITSDLLGQPAAASMPGLRAFATRTGALA